MMNVGIIFYAARETGDRFSAMSPTGMRLPRAGFWYAATGRLRTKAFSISKPENFFDRARNRDIAATLAGRAACLGPCTVSTPATNTAVIRAFSKRRKPAPITTSRTVHRTAFRRGISMRRSKAAS